jgi:hypothetical protein
VLQFYFLSIVSNLLAGASLASDAFARRLPGLAAFTAALAGRRGKLFAGLAALLVGVGTLFVPAGGALVVGDLFPSVVGMVMGIALLFEVFKQDAMFPAERADKGERGSIGYRVTLGLLGIAAAVLHFFLPERPIF